MTMQRCNGLGWVMQIDDKDYCDQCKEEVPTGIWWAKDGHEYCNTCYRQKYPKWKL